MLPLCRFAEPTAGEPRLPDRARARSNRTAIAFIIEELSVHDYRNCFESWKKRKKKRKKKRMRIFF